MIFPTPITRGHGRPRKHHPPSRSPSPAPPETSQTVLLTPVKRGRGRPKKHPVNSNYTSAPSDICFVIDDTSMFTIDDNFSATKLPQYTASRHKEIAGLLEKEVFQIADPQDVPTDARIFKSRFVDEIKNAGTEKAFEKSRLVVQAYNDMEKDLVLTQSPTI